MEPPSIETVYQAVYTLFKDSNVTEKEKASLWLGEFQKSLYAWKIADEMLYQKVDIECCYFAAQTLRTKIQYSFHEVPLENQISLKDSLLKHIANIDHATSPPIVTQLCLAVADLALQMSSWKDPISELITQLNPVNSRAVLEILKVLPEELNSRALRLGENRRQEVLEQFRAFHPMLFECWTVCLKNAENNVTIQNKVLQCYTSWVLIYVVPPVQAADNLIIKFAFHTLSSPDGMMELHESAGDCLSALFQCLQTDENYPSEIDTQLYLGVESLKDLFHLVSTREEEEKALNYARIFTDLAEFFIEKMNTNHFSMKTLDLLLICATHYDYEVASITFSFWHRLSDSLYQKNDDSLTEVFKPYVLKLIDALKGQNELDSDLEGLLESGDDFSEFRKRVYELIKDVIFIVGSSVCFRQMSVYLWKPNIQWPKLESALFIMKAVAKNIVPKENEVVPEVLEAVLRLPIESTHVAVQNTAILLLGELCDWIDAHPHFVEPVLNFLIACLRQPHVANTAADAFHSICSVAKTHIVPHVESLLPVVSIIHQLDSKAISNDSACKILKGLGYAVSLLPHNDILPVFGEMCEVQVKALVELLNNSTDVIKSIKANPCVWMDRLAAILRSVNPKVDNSHEHPCLEVVLKCWPVLEKICQTFKADIYVMERCCRCLRFTVRCIGKHSNQLLIPIENLLVTLYNEHQHSCFLYLGSVLVDEYGADLSNQVPLLKMLEAFIPPTFMHLQKNGQPISGLTLKHHPDTIDDFFRLCQRFILRAPIPFLTLSDENISFIMQLAVYSVTLDHKDANASVTKFLCDLISCGKCHASSNDGAVKQELVVKVLVNHGQSLVDSLIQASIFLLPSYMIVDIAGTFFELLTYQKVPVHQWLQEALSKLPTHNSGGTETVSHTQLLEFYSGMTCASNPKTLSQLLKTLARQFR
nr:PREDICTED: transportin-3 [Bemisia tabaci]